MQPPPGSFTISFNLDQNLFALGLISVFGILGLVVMVIGLANLRSTALRPGFLAYAREQIPGAAEVDDAPLREALVARRRAKAWGLFFGGVGILLVSAAWLGGSWLARGDFLLSSAVRGWATTFLIYLTAILLLAVGQVYGVQRLRARSGSQVAGGSERPRRLTDFVPRSLLVACVAGLALIWAQTLVALPSMRDHPATRLLGGQAVPLSYGRAIYLAGPATAVLVVAVGALILRWTMALPPLRFCAVPELSAAIDAGYRRETVLALLFQGAQALFFLSGLQFMLILDNTPNASSAAINLVAAPFFVLIAIWYLFVLLRFSRLQQKYPASARESVRTT
jgi:hypothetical protein